MKKILSLLLAIVFSLALFAQKGEDKQVVNRNLKPIYTFDKNQKVNQKVNYVFLDEKSYEGALIGRTNYDLQSNSAVATRLVNNQDGTVSAVWTQDHSDEPGGATRGTGYNYCTDYTDVTSWLYYDHDGNQTVESFRTGWPVLLSNGTTEFVASHVNTVAGFYGHTQTIGAAGHTWTESDIPGGPEAMLWPRGASDGDNYYVIGVDDYVTSQAEIEAVHFYSSNDAGATWTYGGKLPDFNTYYNNGQGDVYAIDAKDNYVAVVVFGDFGDTRLWKSDDYGSTWTQTVINDFPVDAYDGTAGTIIDMDVDGVADTVYTCDQNGDVIIDSQGKVHVVFSRMKYLDEDAADDGAFSYFPYTDYLLYWNEDMGAGVYDASDITGASMLDMSVPDAVDTVAWTPDLNNNDTIFEFADSDDAFGKYYVSITSFSKLGIDADDNIYLTYTTVMEGDDYIKEDATPSAQSFRHVWLRKRFADTQTWSNEAICISNEVTNSENVFPTIARNVTNGVAMIMYQYDGEPGLHIRGDEDAVSDNYIVFKAIPEEALGVSEKINTKLNVSVYPNPTNSTITITNVLNSDISIYNILGAEVMSVDSNSERQIIDMSNLPEGTYFVRVSNIKGVVTEKVMLVK